MTSGRPEGRAAKRPLATILVLAISGIAADQVTKALAVAFLVPGKPIPLVFDLFQLSLLRNPGAAFSAAANLTVVLSIMALVVLIAVSIWVVPKVKSRIWAVAVGMGMAGVAGNFVDRLLRPPSPFQGHVIDFLSLKYFAVFNVADMLLTAAAILVVVITLFVKIDPAGRPLSDRSPTPNESAEGDTAAEDGDPAERPAGLSEPVSGTKR